jgi:hypothetical protein
MGFSLKPSLGFLEGYDNGVAQQTQLDSLRRNNAYQRDLATLNATEVNNYQAPIVDQSANLGVLEVAQPTPPPVVKSPQQILADTAIAENQAKLKALQDQQVQVQGQINREYIPTAENTSNMVGKAGIFTHQNTEANPDLSPLQKKLAGSVNENQFNSAINNIAAKYRGGSPRYGSLFNMDTNYDVSGIGPVVGDVASDTINTVGGALGDFKEYVTGTTEGMAERNKIEEAVAWLRSDEVRGYLRTKPQLLLEANEDLLKFYDTYSKQIELDKDNIKLTTDIEAATYSAENPDPAALIDPQVVDPIPTTTAGIKVDGQLTTADKIVTSSPGKTITPKKAAFYSKNPKIIGAEFKLAIAQREQLKQQALLASKYQQNEAYLGFKAKLDLMDVNLYYLDGMQGIRDFNNGNSARLSKVWSHFEGSNITIQPRSDGNYNVLSDGKVRNEGVTSQTLTSLAQRSFSKAFRDSQAAFATTKAKAVYESKLKINEKVVETANNLKAKVGEINAQTLGDIQKAFAKPGTIVNMGEGKGLIVQNGTIYMIDTTGVYTDINGNKANVAVGQEVTNMGNQPGGGMMYTNAAVPVPAAVPAAAVPVPVK